MATRPAVSTSGGSLPFSGVPPSVVNPPTNATSSRTRKRKKTKRPIYKRPVLMSFLTLLILVMAVGGYGLIRLESTVNALHQVSTIPPEVSDNTYVDGDDATPTDLVTAKVDTDPAKTAVANSDISNRFQTSSGVTGRISDAASNTGAIAAGALQASGLTSAKGEPMTILLMGVDARPGSAIDFGVRPDSLIVLRLDPVENSCRLLSIPRDTRVNLPGYGDSKINHALMVGGIPYQLLVTQDYLGIPIDHYFLIDFTAFQTVVDAVGGISVQVPTDLSKNDEVVYTKGTHDFDGEEALKFARFRSTSSDGDATRVERHWAILSALATSTKNTSLAKEVNAILPQIDDHIRTDMSVSQMLELADSYGGSCRNIDRSEIAKLSGTRVKLSDPILGHTDYFNVVSEPTRQARVAELMGETPATTATPGTSPAASPEASPVASPASSPIPQASPSYTPAGDGSPEASPGRASPTPTPSPSVTATQSTTPRPTPTSVVDAF
ncbi:MAG: LCP family protein [Thermomicrobiales bacterium]